MMLIVILSKVVFERTRYLLSIESILVVAMIVVLHLPCVFRLAMNVVQVVVGPYTTTTLYPQTPTPPLTPHFSCPTINSVWDHSINTLCNDIIG